MRKIFYLVVVLLIIVMIPTETGENEIYDLDLHNLPACRLHDSSHEMAYELKMPQWQKKVIP